MKMKPLGGTGLSVTPICFGTSALGNFPAQYGYEVGTEQAVATMRRVFEGPANFVDTSNEYGNGGDAERRIGRALAEVGGLPSGFIIGTKVDPRPGSTDFSGERVRASVAESLERLGLDKLQLVFFHDPEKITFEEGMAPNGPAKALVALKEEGLIENIGVAGGPIDLMLRYVETGIFEAVISHNRYTLVDQSAEPLIAACAGRGIAFINAAPYGGGMLVKGPDIQPNYCYAPASPEIVTAVRAMKRVCDANGIPLAAAALQFSLRNTDITSTIVGISAPERVDETLRLAEWIIPAAVWEELRAVIPAKA